MRIVPYKTGTHLLLTNTNANAIAHSEWVQNENGVKFVVDLVCHSNVYILHSVFSV